MKQPVKASSDLLREPGYVYQVPNSNLAAQARISNEDDIILLSYRNAHNKPRTTIIHS